MPLRAFALTGNITVNPQVGGVPTRFTFEGQTSTGDGPISEVTFTFPEGFDLADTQKQEASDDTGVEALTLEGLTRVPVESTTQIEGQTVRLTFDPAIAPTYKDETGQQQPTTLRIYIREVVTPNKGQDYTLKATYTTDGRPKTFRPRPVASSPSPTRHRARPTSSPAHSTSRRGSSRSTT